MKQKTIERIKLIKKQHNRCFYCERHFMTSSLTSDHFLPASLNYGVRVPRVACCRLCNQIKANLNPILFVGKLETMLKNTLRKIAEVRYEPSTGNDPSR